ncbi:MAG: zinc-ribbon domain-containing protein, partial [Clostridia bacterium]|nr:zinc-ribbon domain-containing protein [Clostridia bacterium]
QNGTAGMGAGFGAAAAISQIMQGNVSAQPQAAAPAADYSASGETKFWSQCGEKIPRSAKFCPECGAKLI